MNLDNFRNQKLPQSNPHQELETLSRKKLLDVLTVDKFELRDELQADKGIDIHAELKKDGYHTNLRFPIQLKSTKVASKNINGSIHYQIKVSNLNYLLNDGFDGYYVLYVHDEDQFYYESANTIHRNLNDKYINSEKPANYTVIFEKKLNLEVAQYIHNEVLHLGFVRRQFNGLAQLTPALSLQDKLIINQDLSVENLTKKIDIIKEHGLLLINEAKYDMIIQAVEQSYSNQNEGAVFHFVAGTAYYYQGNMNLALEHFKKVEQSDDKLEESIKNIFKYLVLNAKKSLGIVLSEKSRAELNELLSGQYIRLYLILEQANVTFLTSKLCLAEKIEIFNEKIQEVLLDVECTPYVKLIAENYVCLIQGHVINEKLVNYLCSYRASLGNPFIKSNVPPPNQSDFETYHKKNQDIIEKCEKEGNNHILSIVKLNQVKVAYTKYYYTNVILGYNEETEEFKNVLGESDLIEISKLITNMQATASYFKEVNYADNTIAALSQLYELYHFIEDFVNAKLVLDGMYELARNNYLEGLETKIDFLKNEGTSHELFSKFIRDGMRSHNTESSEILSIGDKVKEMDKNDLSNPLSLTSTYCIHVMPFGYFVFEKHLLEAVLDILNVNKFAKEGFRRMTGENTVPIANIFDSPILQEGPNKEISYTVGVETHRRFYNIRLALKEIGAKLINIKFED